MKTLNWMCLFLVTSFAFASSGDKSPMGQKGSYKVISEFPYPEKYEGLFGIYIRDDVPNTLWQVDNFTSENVVIDMSTGIPTGDVYQLKNCEELLDQTYLKIPGGTDQFIFANFESTNLFVFEAPGKYLRRIGTPSFGLWDEVFGVAAGHDHLYISNPFEHQIAWGTYTGTEKSVNWKCVAMPGVTGLAFRSDYLFVCSRLRNVDNLFIHEINPDGSVNMEPVWFAKFTEDPFGPDGSIDYDGEYLWVAPDSDGLYKLEIDWNPSSSLETITWAGIKNKF